MKRHIIALNEKEMKSLLYLTGSSIVNAKAFLKYFSKFISNNTFHFEPVGDDDVIEFVVDTECTCKL